jgi:hypothetical protein
MRPNHVRQLAAELELVSHGSTQAFNPAGGASVPDSREPSGEAHPPHLQFLADWERRGEAAVSHWRDVLKTWRGHGQVRPKGKSEREIVLEDGAGHSPEDVARRFRCTPTSVRKWRVEAKLDPESGTDATGVGPQESLARALWLVSERGCSVRQAELLTGVPKSTINDRRRAA